MVHASRLSAIRETSTWRDTVGEATVGDYLISRHRSRADVQKFSGDFPVGGALQEFVDKSLVGLRLFRG